MTVLKRTLALVLALGMIAMFFSACDRNITRVEEVAAPANCFECHSDQNTFLVAAYEQWENSVHGSSLNIDRGGSGGCAGCHISEGFVQRANGETVTGNDNPTPIHCFTCHAPHSEGNFGLRWNAIATSLTGDSFDLGNGNLCVACHQARRNVNTYVKASNELSDHWGPHHSVQGDNIIGTNGYEYTGFTYEISNHRSATDDGCVDCHMKTTSNSVVGGHSWNMAYELRDEGGDVTEVLNTAACAECHGEIDDFSEVGFDGYSVQDSVEVLIEELATLLETAGLWTDGHPASVTTSADSAGAIWNLLMVEEDRSLGVHNKKFAMGLLHSSIMFMEGNLPQSSSVAKK